MNCAVKANTVDHMAQAGKDTTEEGTLQFLTGVGIKTGIDVSKIDGVINIEQIFQSVGDIFFIRDCIPEAMAELEEREACEASQAMLEGLCEMIEHTADLESQYVKKITEKRALVAGGSKILMFPRNSDENIVKRDPNENVTPLSELLTRDDFSSDDVKEFFTGMGIRADADLYVNPQSLRDAMRGVVSTMAKVKATCVNTLERIRAICPVHAEGRVSRAAAYMKCQVQAIKLHEDDYAKRVAEHQLYVTGKVVPFRR